MKQRLSPNRRARWRWQTLLLSALLLFLFFPFPPLFPLFFPSRSETTPRSRRRPGSNAQQGTARYGGCGPSPPYSSGFPFPFFFLFFLLLSCSCLYPSDAVLYEMARGSVPSGCGPAGRGARDVFFFLFLSFPLPPSSEIRTDLQRLKRRKDSGWLPIASLGDFLLPASSFFFLFPPPPPPLKLHECPGDLIKRRRPSG